MMLDKKALERMYVNEKSSVAHIANTFSCSENKVNYWMKKYGIEKRNISDALYLKKNPAGDPFHFKTPKNNNELFLYGLGLGLYWGEGNKKSKTAIRLGNTDPDLLRFFLDFLTKIYTINETRLRFGLQIFTDNDSKTVKEYWCKKLKISSEKFQKITITPSVRKGTYGQRSEYGMLTIYFSNTKIRDSIVGAIEVLREQKEANVAQLVERVHGGSQ